jgi:dienelactone hydrolase
LFGGSEGGIGGELVASLLASHGYPALSIAYFGEPGLPRGLAEIPLEYFTRALRWLVGRPGVDENRLVVFGASRGSEAALLLAAHFPKLVRAVIAVSPSNVSVGSFPGCKDAAWTLGGRPIPYQCSYGPTENTTGAAIPVRRIRSPLLLVCGGVDSVWPSCPMAHAVERRHRAHGDVLLDYPHAGHGVGFVPNIPIWFEHLAGDSPEANPLAREQFWPRLLRFVAAAPA